MHAAQPPVYRFVPPLPGGPILSHFVRFARAKVRSSPQISTLRLSHGPWLDSRTSD